ncbi:MAG: hypothetical protein WDZ68_00815, partial [Candidatus Paceibacterota bacterium]
MKFSFFTAIFIALISFSAPAQAGQYHSASDTLIVIGEVPQQTADAMIQVRHRDRHRSRRYYRRDFHRFEYRRPVQQHSGFTFRIIITPHDDSHRNPYGRSDKYVPFPPQNWHVRDRTR